jgi:hypothetical protein
MTEKELQNNVLRLAGLSGFLKYHTRNSKGSHKGFPDLVLCKPPRLIFIELKSENGRVKDEQLTWGMRLSDCPVEYYLWRPADWDNGTIQDVIVGGKR